MKSLLKNHAWAIALAIFVGALMVVPQLYANKSLGAEFKGVYQMVNDDEVYYSARAREIVDGHVFLSNPYLLEHKSGAPMQFWLPDFLLAKPLAIFGVDIFKGYLFYDFLLPAILALLSYTLLFKLTRSKFLGLCGALLLHVGMYLETFNRSPSPQLNFVFWLLIIIFLLDYLEKKKFIYLMLSGFFLGLMINLYPYFWTFYYVVIALYFLLSYLIDKKFDFKILYLLPISLFFGLPYIYFSWQSTFLPSYHESLIRLGLLYTRFPSGIRVVVPGFFLAGAFILLLWKRFIPLEQRAILLLSGVLGGVIAMNHHLVTGKNLEFANHYDLPAHYMFVVALVFLVRLGLEKLKRGKKIVFASLLLFVMIVSGRSVSEAWARQSAFDEKEIDRQRYAGAFTWLNENTEKDSVVFTDKDQGNFIPAYTHNNVFFTRAANLFFISDEEVWERFVINNYWEEYDDEFLKANERSIWGTEFINKYNHCMSRQGLYTKVGLEWPCVRYPEERFAAFLEYAENKKQTPFFDLLSDYRVDYFSFDVTKNPDYLEDYPDAVEKVFEEDGIVIYEKKN